MARLSSSVALAAMLILALVGCTPARAHGWLLAASIVLLAVCLKWPASSVTVLNLVVVGIVGLKTLLPEYNVWPVHLGVPLVLAACYSIVGPPAVPTASWAAPGSLGPGIKLLTVALAAGSAGGLFLWYAITHPQVAVPTLPNHLPVPVVVAGGCAFAAINALMEELTFRGVALQALATVFRSKWPPIILQALAFGALHYTKASIPSGIAGAGLSFLFGAVQGFLANLAGGVLAACLVHFVIDLIVFGLMMNAP